MTMKRRSHGRGLLLTLLALLFAQAACMSTKAPERTGTMEAFGLDMNARRARLSAQNLADLYMSTVELTADSIIKVSRVRPSSMLTSSGGRTRSPPSNVRCSSRTRWSAGSTAGR